MTEQFPAPTPARRPVAHGLELAEIVQVVRPLATDLIATFCFYATYALTGRVALATVLAGGLGIGQIGWTLIRGRRAPALQWASVLLVVCVGALSFATGDARYVLYQTSAVYLAVGATMLRSGWLARYVPPSALAHLPRRVVSVFGAMWAVLLLATGVLSLTLIWTVPARTVALVMGIWAPSSKIVLLCAQCVAGRRIVKRGIARALRPTSGRDPRPRPSAET